MTVTRPSTLPTEPPEFGEDRQFAPQAISSRFYSAQDLNSDCEEDAMDGSYTYVYPISGDYRLTYGK